MKDVIDGCETPTSTRLRLVYGQREVWDVARTLATEVIFRFKTLGPPFNPHDVTAQLSVPVEERDMEADGLLEGWPARPRIVLRQRSKVGSRSEQARQVFSLAHELGHLILRQDLSCARGAPPFENHDPVEEQLADAFAVEFLMPQLCFADDVHKSGVDPLSCLGLAERYGVSLTSLLLRIKSVAKRGPTFMAVLWDYDGLIVRPKWATAIAPRLLQRFRAAGTSIERAAKSPGTAVGQEYLFDGRRLQRWNCASMLLPGSRKILTTARSRQCQFAFRFPPVWIAPPAERHEPQLQLFDL